MEKELRLLWDYYGGKRDVARDDEIALVLGCEGDCRYFREKLHSGYTIEMIVVEVE